MRCFLQAFQLIRCIALHAGLLMFTNNAWAQSEYSQTEVSQQTAKEQRCASLSGTYQYFGEFEGDSKNGIRRPMLDATVFRRIPIRGNPSAVEIVHKVEEGVIQVKIIGENLSPPEGVYFVKNISCEAGWSVFEHNDSGYADGMYVSSKSFIRFSRNDDGALVVYDSYSSESRSLFFFGRASKGELRYRFPLLK